MQYEYNINAMSDTIQLLMENKLRFAILRIY